MSAHQFQAPFNAVESLVEAIQADAHRSTVLIRMREVTAQTSDRHFQMSDAAHKLFELAFDPVLAGLKALHVRKEQVFDVLGDWISP